MISFAERYHDKNEPTAIAAPSGYRMLLTNRHQNGSVTKDDTAAKRAYRQVPTAITTRGRLARIRRCCQVMMATTAAAIPIVTSISADTMTVDGDITGM
ncbi:hypothetical protein D8S78_24220 [Natrialba swarupiae]|nr:hypothetical protein [Natrialba swarupiae]